MTIEIFNKMIEEINIWISLAKDEYQTNGRSNWYNRTIDRINGMVKMLTIATEKEWYFDWNGVHEKNV